MIFRKIVGSGLGFSLIEVSIATGITTVLALSVGSVMVKTVQVHRSEQVRGAIASTARQIKNVVNSRRTARSDCLSRVSFPENFNAATAVTDEGTRVLITKPAEGSVPAVNFAANTVLPSDGRRIRINDIRFANASVVEALPSGLVTYSGEIFLVATPAELDLASAPAHSTSALFGREARRKFVTRLNLTIDTTAGNSLVACDSFREMGTTEKVCADLGLRYEPDCPFDDGGCCAWSYGPKGGDPERVNFCRIGTVGLSDGRTSANCRAEKVSCTNQLAKGFSRLAPDCTAPTVTYPPRPQQPPGPPVPVPVPPPPPPVPIPPSTSATCVGALVNGCDLPTAPHGSSAGTCQPGLLGTCSYTCTNGHWDLGNNSCSIDRTLPPPPPAPVVPAGPVKPSPVYTEPSCDEMWFAYLYICGDPTLMFMSYGICSVVPPSSNCTASVTTQPATLPPNPVPPSPPGPPAGQCFCGNGTVSNGQYCGFCTLHASPGFGVEMSNGFYDVSQCVDQNLVPVGEEVTTVTIMGGLTSCYGQRRPVTRLGPGQYQFNAP